MSQIDTIIALATPPGRGSVGILRISGPLAITVSITLLGKIPRPRQAEYLAFRDSNGTTLDQGIALFFPKPQSFTGEDILELQGHGSPVILDMLLQHIITIPGIRIAHPGEFSERAFLNGKLDLIQAEAISDLINASSAHAARSAINSLQGIFSDRIHKLVEALTDLRIHIEAAINFPDEEINLLSKSKIETNLNNIITSLDQIYIDVRQGNILREGIKVVIAGEPNVGKSSLLNRLVGREVAIVTPVAGTTRDVLCEHIHLDGIPLHIIDTAGIRNPSDEVERIGIARAWNEIKHADHILLIVDSSSTPLGDPDILCPTIIKHLPPVIPITVIRNKADLTCERINFCKEGNYSSITISAQTGAGIDLLRDHLKQSAGFTNNLEGIFLAHRRHLEALKTATIHLNQSKELLVNAYASELLAEELRLAQQSLNEITGKFSSNDLINKIFSSFCIGK